MGTSLRALAFTCRALPCPEGGRHEPEVTPLTAAERELAGEFNLKPIALDRAWEQWALRVGPFT